MNTNVITCITLLCVVYTFSGSVEASPVSRPTWTDRPPKEDAQFKYYVGRASAVKTETAAFQDATKSAREIAVGENFGLSVKVESKTVQTLQTQDNTTFTESSSRKIHLEEFELVDTYKEMVGNRFDVWLLFRYSKDAIGRERKRLIVAKDDSHELDLIEQGGNLAAIEKGTLEIDSTPRGAQVRIDGMSRLGDTLMRTPLRLKGLFNVGQHLVEIDNPRFGLHQSKVTLTPARTTRIDPVLVPAVSVVSVESVPAGAVVWLNDVEQPKLTPTKVSVPSGVEYLLRIEHAETLPYREAMTVARGETITKLVELVPLPSTLSVSSDTVGASVAVDGHVMPALTPTGPLAVARGEHAVVITKAGYAPFSTKVFVGGGKNEVIVAPPLIADASPNAASFWATTENDSGLKTPTESVVRGIIEFAITSCSIERTNCSGKAWGVGIVVPFHQAFGVAIDALWFSGEPLSDHVDEFSGGILRIGLPILLTEIAITPLLAVASTDYSMRDNSGRKVELKNHTQTGFGIEMRARGGNAPLQIAGFLLGLTTWSSSQGIDGATAVSLGFSHEF